jgi:hypothetical protein
VSCKPALHQYFAIGTATDVIDSGATNATVPYCHTFGSVTMPRLEQPNRTPREVSMLPLPTFRAAVGRKTPHLIGGADLIRSEPSTRLRTYSTVDYLGLGEKWNNPDF